MLCMLQVYLDDSGTHASSPVVVVAGAIGHAASWAELESKWRAKLAEPLPGKPPIKAFHLSELLGHYGDFKDYRPAEVDALRHDFRQIILESNLHQIVTAISRPDWDNLVVGPYRNELGGAEEMCFTGIVLKSVEFLRQLNAPNLAISYVYDLGRQTPEFQRLFQLARDPSYRPEIASVTWGRVEQMPALQAADFIANENFRAAQEWMKDGTVTSPHFKRLLEGSTLGFVLGRKEIEAEISRRGIDGRLLDGN
jgi:hypothetical protein